ncbi:tyrosine-type recombinase/integrase [Microbacterium sp. NPDC055683]
MGELGSIAYTVSGSRVSATAWTRDASGERRKLRATAPSKDDAAALLRNKAAQLALTDGLAGSDSTFRDLLDTWCADVVSIRNIREQTKRMYYVKSRKLGRSYGAIPAIELTPQRVQKIVNELAAENSAHEYSVLRGVLSQALRWAVVARILPVDPLAVTQRPRPKKVAKPVSITPHQLRVFRTSFAAFVDEGVRYSNRRNAQLAVDIIVGLGGIRIAEALAIRWRDVDFENGVVEVCGTVVQLTGQPVFRQPQLKYEGQERFVQLADDGIAMRALRAARQEAPAFRRGQDDPVIGRIQLDESPWVSPSIVSAHFDSVTWRPEVVAALAETGLTPRQLTPHTLRRTVATAVSRAEDVTRAAELLAHANTKTTQRHYITPEVETVDAVAIDAVFGL